MMKYALTILALSFAGVMSYYLGSFVIFGPAGKPNTDKVMQQAMTNMFPGFEVVPEGQDVRPITYTCYTPESGLNCCTSNELGHTFCQKTQTP